MLAVSVLKPWKTPHSFPKELKKKNPPGHKWWSLNPHSAPLLGECHTIEGRSTHLSTVRVVSSAQHFCNPFYIHLIGEPLSAVDLTGQWHYSQYGLRQIQGLKASSLGSSRHFQRLMATLCFSVLPGSVKTLLRITLINVTVFVSGFSDRTRSRVSPSFTWEKNKIWGTLDYLIRALS